MDLFSKEIEQFMFEQNDYTGHLTSPNALPFLKVWPVTLHARISLFSFRCIAISLFVKFQVLFLYSVAWDAPAIHYSCSIGSNDFIPLLNVDSARVCVGRWCTHMVASHKCNRRTTGQCGAGNKIDAHFSVRRSRERTSENRSIRFYFSIFILHFPLLSSVDCVFLVIKLLFNCHRFFSLSICGRFLI